MIEAIRRLKNYLNFYFGAISKAISVFMNVAISNFMNFYGRLFSSIAGVQLFMIEELFEALGHHFSSCVSYFHNHITVEGQPSPLACKHRRAQHLHGAR